MPPKEQAPLTVIELTREESLKLLAGVSVGRVAFSHRALPTVRPVNHVFDDGHIVIRTHSGAALLGPAGAGGVVAYEVDEIDPETHTGWSVIVIGTSTMVQEGAEQERYRRMLHPWITDEMEHVVRISPDIVTGYRLTRD